MVPAGIWMTGLISLKDNIDLHIEKNAVIMAAPDRNLFFKTKDGKRDSKATPLINASKRKNICITGEGTIDGNGAVWRPVKRSKVSDVEWKDFLYMGGTVSKDGQLWYPFNLKNVANTAETAEAQEKQRTNMIRFTDCENVMVKDVTLHSGQRNQPLSMERTER